MTPRSIAQEIHAFAKTRKDLDERTVLAIIAHWMRVEHHTVQPYTQQRKVDA